LLLTPEERRPLGRNMHRWEDNVKIYIKDANWEDVEWILLAEDRDQW
jgi:hypothetical protein